MVPRTPAGLARRCRAGAVERRRALSRVSQASRRPDAARHRVRHTHAGGHAVAVAAAARQRADRELRDGGRRGRGLSVRIRSDRTVSGTHRRSARPGAGAPRDGRRLPSWRWRSCCLRDGSTSRPGMLICIAALAGAFLPPISVLTRTMWRHRFDDERMRFMAFSIDGVLIELAFTVGPMIVAALLAAASATARSASRSSSRRLRVPLFALSPAIRHWPRRLRRGTAFARPARRSRGCSPSTR